MRPWRILPRVREVEILRHEKSAVGLSCSPHDMVIAPGDLFIWHGLHIVAEIGQKRNELNR
jgi:hypothetical protein